MSNSSKCWAITMGWILFWGIMMCILSEHVLLRAILVCVAAYLWLKVITPRMFKAWPLILLLCLPSCVEFKAASNATYKGPPWGKVAYQKGDELFTTDHDAGFAALVTGVQNIANGAIAGIAAGQVSKSIDAAHQAADVAITRSGNKVIVDQAALQAAKPTIINPATQVAVPATLPKLISP